MAQRALELADPRLACTEIYLVEKDLALRTVSLQSSLKVPLEHADLLGLAVGSERLQAMSMGPIRCTNGPIDEERLTPRLRFHI